MQSQQFTKAGLFALLLATSVTGSWEYFWRSRDVIPTHNDDKFLWADSREKVYDQNATVFIGSSRIKYDLDIPEWEKLTNEKAVQLALVGTSPRLLLQDLANDTQFKGKLVIDVTEVLFFSQNPAFQKLSAEAITYYKEQTPSQQFSSLISRKLESSLAFLEESNFSLTALLNDLQVPDRKGVFSFPVFPKGFGLTTAERQTYMSPAFLADSNDIKRQTTIWEILIFSDPTPLPSDSIKKAILQEVSEAIAKIQKRGGKVLFVRTPSSGPMELEEEKRYPRSVYWDQLVSAAGVTGIHYKDDSATAGLICPEWSHLSPADAVLYTRELVKSLRKENWFDQ